jgi:hypothetical protein
VIAGMEDPGNTKPGEAVEECPWKAAAETRQMRVGDDANDDRCRVIGAPGGTRTHDLQVRNLTLYPLSYGRTVPARTAARRNRAEPGGEGGIRTLDAGYPTWRFSKPLH